MLVVAKKFCKSARSRSTKITKALLQSSEAEKSLKVVPLVFFPEIIGGAFKQRDVHLMVVWTIAKHRENEKIKSGERTNGLCLKAEIIALIREVFGVGHTQAYDWMSDGVGKYWSRPGGEHGKQKICLLSLNSVLEHVKPETYKVHPVTMGPERIIGFSRVVRKDSSTSRTEIITPQMQMQSLMMGLYASRHNDGRPMPLTAIADETGYNVRTVQRLIRECPGLETNSNYEVLAETQTPAEILEVKAYAKQRHVVHRLKIFSYNELWYLVRQIANSYSMPEWERLGIHNRPRVLKNWARDNPPTLSLHRYHLEVPTPGTIVAPQAVAIDIGFQISIARKPVNFYKNIKK